MGETFVSLLNIHGGDIRVVPTHLVFRWYGNSVVNCLYFQQKREWY